jgi:preprotein translocase subunit SecG
VENVVLTIHLILAVLLTGVVLLQRSEGGGLGMGGGGGGVMTGRQAANALTRLTWIFGIALFVTSIALTIIAARQVSNSSIMDQLGVPASRQESTLPQAPAYVPPPTTGTAGDPLTPPAPDAPAADAPAPEAAAPAVEPVARPAAEAPAPAAPAQAPAQAPAN